MKWVNHLIISGATTAVIAPPLVPIAMLGSTAPDWIEWIIKGLGGHVQHRGITHYLTNWIGGMLFFGLVFDFHHIGLAFAYGGFTHVVADSLTVTGVPFAPWSDRRFHLFGGRLRTGDSGEFFVSGGVVVVCFALAFMFKGGIGGGGGFAPFFYNWAGHYEAGEVDASEWKKNRFKFF